MDEGQKVTLTIKSIDGREPWNKPNSTQIWYTVVTEENSGEPTKFIADQNRDVKTPLTGHSYLGKLFGNKFYPAKDVSKEGEQNVGQSNPTQSFNTPAPAKQAWQPRDDDRIVAQWAIGQAVQLLGSVPVIKNEQIELQAKEFFAMVDRVKGTESLKASAPVMGQPTSAEEKAIVDEDAEFASLLAAGYQADGIDLSEIPF